MGHSKKASDLRALTALRSEGSSRANTGVVDNRHAEGNFRYNIGPQTFALGYMHQDGLTVMPYLSGGEAGTINEGTMSADFLNAKERTWIARYDYDFAGVGLLGLDGMMRHMKGTNINLPTLGGADLQERYSDFELRYVVSTGPIKGLVLRGRYGLYRNNHSEAASLRTANEIRLIIDCT